MYSMAPTITMTAATPVSPVIIAYLLPQCITDPREVETTIVHLPRALIHAHFTGKNPYLTKSMLLFMMTNLAISASAMQRTSSDYHSRLVPSFPCP
jgi:hypothetical protein